MPPFKVSPEAIFSRGAPLQVGRSGWNTGYEEGGYAVAGTR